jgi:hypothetical protein
MPTAWTRGDGRAVDPNQLEADKAICRDEVDQAARVTAARGLAPITLPGQDSPAVKLSIHGAARLLARPLEHHPTSDHNRGGLFHLTPLSAPTESQRKGSAMSCQTAKPLQDGDRDR